MTVLRSILFLIGGLVAGWLVAVWTTPAPAPAGIAERDARAAAGTGRDGRIDALEAALASERERRRELAAELEALSGAVARLEAAPADYARRDAPADDEERGADAAFGDDGPFAERARALRERRDTSPEQRRVERLIEAGFAPDRADWITRRESELRLAALEAQYEARRTGAPLDRDALDADATLRAELGDADYERYLEATGRSTSVGVRSVLGGSAAEQAGLMRGDRLVGYGGSRVYDLEDLNRLTVEGTPDEPVTVDVVRDGQTIQVVIPRGPLGITGGGRFGRRGP